MKTKILFFLICIFLIPVSSFAGKIYDYAEALQNEFTIKKKAKLIKISVMPKLIEQEFATFLIDPLEKDMPRKEIIAKWKPIQKKLIKDGFVFEVELELINKNLDSGIEVELIGDLASRFILKNNLGEKVLMYKYTGKNTRALNFMTPKINLICYFNTKTEKGNPFIKKGVTSFTLEIKDLAEGVADTTYKWSFPLNYYNVRRPQEIKNLFGLRQIRTFRVYKPLVYHKPKTTVIPHIKRIKRKENPEDMEE